jgi:WD40 repeat protein
VALIRRAIPAVVTRQFEITDGAAIRFAQTFYEYVATGRAVDDSVMRARRALRRAKNDTLEWGAPVLYLRAPDTRIFALSAPRPRSLEGRWPRRRPRHCRDPAQQDLSAPLAPPSGPLRVRAFPSSVQILRHRKAVNVVAFSPDGFRLATACDDKTGRIWDTLRGMELLSVGHTGWFNEVSGVAFDPDGRRLATASFDSTTRVWDAGSGQELVKVTCDNSVLGVAFSPDGRRLATANKDKIARIWALSYDD